MAKNKGKITKNKRENSWFKKIIYGILWFLVVVVFGRFLLPVFAEGVSIGALTSFFGEPAKIEGVISDDLGGEIIPVWTGKIKANVSLHNTGDLTIVSNDKLIEEDVLSFLRTYFEDESGKILTETYVRTDFLKPIYSGDKINYFPIEVAIPEGILKGTLVIEVECPTTVFFRRCNSSVEKLRHQFYVKDSSPLKILIVNIAGKSHVDLAVFREKIDAIFGRKEILKTAWSGDNKIYSSDKIGGVQIYYNQANGHSNISAETVAVREALFETFSHLKNQAELLPYDAYTITWAEDYLSNCQLHLDDQDKGCQGGPLWGQLDQYSNRFSPSFLQKNPDLDFVIFVPY